MYLQHCCVLVRNPPKSRIFPLILSVFKPEEQRKFSKQKFYLSVQKCTSEKDTVLIKSKYRNNTEK